MQQGSAQLQHADEAKQNNKSIWALSWMCFFWGVASVMVFTLLPTFLTDELHASKTHIGFIEGFAIFLAFAAKVFSGVVSDYSQTRKPIIMIGTFMSIVIKSMFAMSSSIWWIFSARAIDRLSKGIRSAPTDALIADLSPEKKEGVSYGIRQSLYTFGFVFGSLSASLLMWVSNNNYRMVFWLSVIPATAAFILLKLFVQEPLTLKSIYKKKPWQLSDIKQLPTQFWYLLGGTFLLMLARFSEAFLNFRAKEVGWQIAALPLLLVLYDLIATFVAFPMGKMADKYNKSKLLLAGILVLFLTNIIIINVQHCSGIVFGMLLAGLHMGMTQGLIASMIAGTTLPTLRGTAFALYYLVTGVAVLLGNIVAGHLSDVMGTTGAFVGGVIFTTMASVYCYFMIKNKKI